MPQPRVRPDQESAPGTTRWVKFGGIIVIALIVLMIVLHLTGNSLGGPGSHLMPSSLIEHGLRPV
jgi:hypothetical protein